jgi:excisionase family DNA binding protein
MAAPAPPTKDKLEQGLQNVLHHSIGLTAGAARANLSVVSCCAAAATWWRACLWTVQKAITDDELPAFKLGRDWRIWLTDLDEWTAKR